ncbi:MAG TPA: FAD-dependent oxidoreductase [Longimicrobiales bacterium]
MMKVERVVVIGGGLIGCTIAWRLAQRGLQVTVVEKDQPASKASWAAAGMLLPLMEAGSPLAPLTDASFQAYPAFVEELREITGIDAELRLEGPGKGSVDNRKLGRAAYDAAKQAGAIFRLRVEARKVVCSTARFQRVALSNGAALEADAVVIAAGAWSGELLGLPFKLPVVPVRGQMLAVEHEPPVAEHIIKGDKCYLVPRGRRLLIGATVEHVGFDERTTEAGIAELRAAAQELLPAVADARVLETWAGLRPGTPDDLPILGADPRVPGVFYATGHFRNGILLAPVTAQVITELIAEGTTSFDLEPFSVARFVVPIDDPRCDLCGAPMLEWHCRIVCPACGYQRDCSDP